MSMVMFADPTVLSVIDMVAVVVSGDRPGGGGPELGWTAAGVDLGAGRAAGERERVERALDRFGGLVVLEGV